MKAKNLVVLSVLMVLLLTLTSFKTATISNDTISESLIQDGLIVYATYDGYEDYGYNFITKDKAGDEQTLTFQIIEEAVLKAFDLNSEAFVGTKFKITFNRNIKFSKDADGMDDEDEINMITNLEKL